MYGKLKSVKVVVGISILLIIIFLVAAAPVFTTYLLDAGSQAQRLQGFSGEHFLGTDRYGRDLWTRTLYGGRVTLISSFIALGAALFIGTIIGILTGLYNESIFDIVLMRIVDVLLAFPFMIFAMVIAGLWGAGLGSLLSAVLLVWWVPFARLARSIVLQVKSSDSIAAARVLGAPGWRIVLYELLPRTIGQVFVLATFELGTLILSISALSFLGMGAQPPTPEWGSMLSDGRAHFFQYPHVLFGPAFFVVFTVLALNLLGEGMRDALDPLEEIKL